MSLNIYTFRSVILYKSERCLVQIIYLLVCQERKKRNTSRNQSSVHIWVVCKRKSKLETKIQQNQSRVCFFSSFLIELPWLRAQNEVNWLRCENFFHDSLFAFSIGSSVCSHACPFLRSPALSLLLFLMLQILYRSSLTVSKLDKFKLIYSFHFVHLEINLLQTFWECSQFSRISPHNTNARMLKCWDPFDLRQHRLHA